MTPPPAETCSVCGHAMRPLCGTHFPGQPWMHRCGGCGFCAVRPVPAESAAMYDDRYTANAAAEGKNRRLAPDYLRKLRPFLPVKGPFRFLEVGGSTGWLAQAVRDQTGAEVTLLEPGRTAVAEAQARGLRAVAGFIEDFATAERFDVIFAGHVIEHVTDVVRFLSVCHGLLAEGGILVLLTPNADAWKFRLFGAGWAWLAPGEHTLLLGPASAPRVLTRAGFEPVRIRGAIPAIGHYPVFLTRWLSGLYTRLLAKPAASPAASAPAPAGPAQSGRRLGRPILWMEFALLTALDFLLGKNRADELLIVGRKRRSG